MFQMFDVEPNYFEAQIYRMLFSLYLVSFFPRVSKMWGFFHLLSFSHAWHCLYFLQWFYLSAYFSFSKWRRTYICITLQQYSPLEKTHTVVKDTSLYFMYIGNGISLSFNFIEREKLVKSRHLFFLMYFFSSWFLPSLKKRDKMVVLYPRAYVHPKCSRGM